VRVWDLGQRAFWSRFPRWMDAALQRLAEQVAS
jgi:hypothetical protein